MEDLTMRLCCYGDGAVAKKEVNVGIKCFVNEENPGFQGTLKTRYTDFQVFEIAPDGTIVHLTDDRAPAEKKPPVPTFGSAPAIAASAAPKIKRESSAPATPVKTEPAVEDKKESLAPATPVKTESATEDTKESVAPATPIKIESAANKEEKENVATELTTTPIKTEATVQTGLSKSSCPDTPINPSLQVDDRPKSSTTPTSHSNAQLAKNIEAAFSPNRVNTPPSEDGSDDSIISLEDTNILNQWFGPTLVNQMISLYKDILSKPKSKLESFGDDLESQAIPRAARSPIHGAIKRIFNSKLDSTTKNDKILVYAASANRSWKTRLKVRLHPPNLLLALKTKENALSSSETLNMQLLTSMLQTVVSRQKQNPRQQQRGQPTGKLGWQDLGGEYLHFTMYKENKDTMEVITYLASCLKIKPRDFAFAGTKDRRAVTVQRVSVRRQYAKSLARLNAHLYAGRLGNFKYEKHGLELGELTGNHFHITLRDCHFGDDQNWTTELKLEHGNKVVGQAVKHLQQHGFINYFGLQRFGTFGIGTDEIGLQILKGDFKGAVDAILTYSDEVFGPPKDFSEPEYGDRVSQYDLDRAQAIIAFRNGGKKSDVLEIMPRKFSGEIAVMRHLMTRNCHNDYEGAIMSIHRNLRSMYLHAYQSLVWNTVASERWARHGNKVVEGDLVLVVPEAAPADEVDESGEVVVHAAADDTAISRDDVYQRARPLTAEEAASGKYNIFDIVLPLPGYDVNYPANAIGDFYKTFMAGPRGGGIDPGNMRRSNKDFSLSGSYRKLMAEVKDCSFELKVYINSLEELVETDWQKLQKSRGEDPMAPRNFYQEERGSGPNNKNARKAEIRSEAIKMKDQYKNSAALQAWKALPDAMPGLDKACADAAALKVAQRKANYPDDLTPVIKDTWIQTDPEDWTKKTGVKSTIVLNEKMASETPVTKSEPEIADAVVSVEEASAVPIPTSPAVKAEEAALVPAPDSVASSSNMDIGFKEDEFDAMDVDDAPVKGFYPKSTFKRLVTHVSGVPIICSETATYIDEEGVERPMFPQDHRIGVVIKFSLGSSQYATIALRELMKAGGVRTFKPDFSRGI
ncbi:uncharacterized protein L3040_004436 [Drepanopeziza brunnea f. sp. 'multigermtubi']|uniref:uncharacterized protein n=1 Tax=Drepanopeziza brunnea f. sp. 'multigermtubi' TaxID=698441 RepID=UPI00238D98BF|nr:hypothetical protein L3040_004436 [Drepanopeziza brunnea f. sp. 'multigermtubi']